MKKGIYWKLWKTAPQTGPWCSVVKELLRSCSNNVIRCHVFQALLKWRDMPYLSHLSFILFAFILLILSHPSDHLAAPEVHAASLRLTCLHPRLALSSEWANRGFRVILLPDLYPPLWCIQKFKHRSFEEESIEISEWCETNSDWFSGFDTTRWPSKSPFFT